MSCPPQIVTFSGYWTLELSSSDRLTWCRCHSGAMICACGDARLGLQSESTSNRVSAIRVASLFLEVRHHVDGRNLPSCLRSCVPIVRFERLFRAMNQHSEVVAVYTKIVTHLI